MKLKFIKAACAAMVMTLSSYANAIIITVGDGGRLPPVGSSGTFSSEINVIGDYDIEDLTITLFGLTHTFAQDLRISVTHNDDSIILHNSNGGSADFRGDYAFNSLFLNEYTAARGAGLVSSGQFRTSGLMTNNWDGQSAAGAWTLTILDPAAGDIGNLESWSIGVTPTNVSEPATLAMLGLGFMGLALRRLNKQG